MADRLSDVARMQDLLGKIAFTRLMEASAMADRSAMSTLRSAVKVYAALIEQERDGWLALSVSTSSDTQLINLDLD